MPETTETTPSYVETVGAEADAGVDPVEAPTDPTVHGYPYVWAGRTWRIKPQFDLRVFPALKSGDFGRALGLLLGREQAAELLDLDSDEPFTAEVLNAMIEAVNGSGSLPESPASSPS